MGFTIKKFLSLLHVILLLKFYFDIRVIVPVLLLFHLPMNLLYISLFLVFLSHFVLDMLIAYSIFIVIQKEKNTLKYGNMGIKPIYIYWHVCCVWSQPFQDMLKSCILCYIYYAFLYRRCVFFSWKIFYLPPSSNLHTLVLFMSFFHFAQSLHPLTFPCH